MKQKTIILFLSACVFILSSCSHDKICKSEKQEVSKSNFTHSRQVDNTLLFCRVDSILYYSNFANYNKRCWLDRPLFMDTSLRSLDYYDKYQKAFLSDCRLAAMSGINAFAPLFSFSQQNQSRIDLLTSLLNKNDLDGFKITPMVFMPRYNHKDASVMDETKIKILREYIRKLLKSSNVLKVNGKLFVIIYYADVLDSYDNLKMAVNQLRKDFPDKLLFISEIVSPGGKNSSCKDLYELIIRHNGKIPLEYREKVKKHIRDYLDITDGVMYARPANSYAIDVPIYENRFDKENFGKIIKLVDEVLSEKEYKKKYLGLSCSTGYNNPGIPAIDQEIGTKQFRYSIEQSIDADPDFIFCTCWDEVNENDLFKPSVCDGMSKMRMMRYYGAKLQNKKLEPLPGDNTSIPDLILSHRFIVILGEKLEIELLNVPDSDADGVYSVQLQLTDINGKIIKEFPFTVFSQNKMQDKTYMLASEDYKDYEVIIPRLVIKDYKGRNITIDKGLNYIQIRPSWNWNYKYCNQPIRDIITPEELLFKDNIDKKNKEISFSGQIKCDEPLSSVEILENNFPVWAYDVNKVYGHPDTNYILFVNFEKAASKVVPEKGTSGTISLKKSAGYIQPSLSFNEIVGITPSGEKEIKIRDARIRADRFYKYGVFVVIPKKDIETAIIDIDVDWLKTSVAVKDVVEKEIYRDVINRDVILVVQNYQKSPDIPVPINQKTISFSNIKKTPTYDDSIYQLRIISKDGKVFRSKPVIYDAKNSGGKVDYSIYSETKGKKINVEILKSRIPDILYNFDPSRKKLLTANDCRAFDARMGGIEHYGPFLRYLQSNKNEFPASFKTLTPEWVQNNGEWYLKFKEGAFMVFPMDTFPGWKAEILPRGSFTVIFEIMPLSDKKAILLTQQSWRPGALTLYLENGQISGEFINHNNKKFNLNPKFLVPLNKWSKIIISYNLEKMLFQVNDEKAELIDVNGRGVNFTPFVFGGFVDKNKFYGFDGYLKSFRVLHRSIIKDDKD